MNTEHERCYNLLYDFLKRNNLHLTCIDYGSGYRYRIGFIPKDYLNFEPEEYAQANSFKEAERLAISLINYATALSGR
jgi:hypothetical protein